VYSVTWHVRITVQHCMQQGTQQWQWQHRATPQNEPNAWFWPEPISANTVNAIPNTKLRIFGSPCLWEFLSLEPHAINDRRNDRAFR
jgi:hypothetical protein